MVEKSNKTSATYWKTIWRQFRSRKIGMIGLFIIALFTLVGIYAPFLASSKPLVVHYDGEWYFPLFRYLFYSSFYTKPLDIFFNLLIFTFPLLLISLWLFRTSSGMIKLSFGLFFLLQTVLFAWLLLFPVKNPASDPVLNQERQLTLKAKIPVAKTWAFDLLYMNDYARLNTVLNYRLRQQQDQRIRALVKDQERLPTLWQNEQENLKQLTEQAGSSKNNSAVNWYIDRRKWQEEQNSKITFILMPLLRDFHWEDDAGGSQALNQQLPLMELTRINRKDLMAALIFGVRVSLVVGVISVALALIIGIPVGAVAGYYAGTTDIIVCRLLEIWEAMPSFLMLLMVVAIAQNKSIFLVITVIGLFGWTSFSRYIRGEFFKQRACAYVEACRSLGFSDARIIFRHILPNAIPPILTLLPFAIMGAVSSEAGLSFLGLGEEGAGSWGVLMDEGRTAFPGESYLLWPPALLLTTLLIATALVGDALRDAFDPKMHRT